MRNMEIKDQVKAAATMLIVIADTIREAKSIPSGHLYAILMPYMSLETYTSIINGLKDAGVVKESNHLLTWVGPEKEVAK